MPYRCVTCVAVQGASHTSSTGGAIAAHLKTAWLLHPLLHCPSPFLMTSLTHIEGEHLTLIHSSHSFQVMYSEG